MQYRSLKYVSNDFKSPYGELRKRAERPVMYVQSLRAILTEVCKEYFNIGTKYTCDIFTKSNQVYSTRNDKLIVQPNVSVLIMVFTLLGMRRLELVGSTF